MCGCSLTIGIAASIQPLYISLRFPFDLLTSFMNSEHMTFPVHVWQRMGALVYYSIFALSYRIPTCTYETLPV